MPGTLEPSDWQQVLQYRYAGANPRGLDFTKAQRLYFGTGTYSPGGAKPDALMASKGWERIGYDAMVEQGIAAQQNVPLNGNVNEDLYLAKARAVGPTVC